MELWGGSLGGAAPLPCHEQGTVPGWLPACAQPDLKCPINGTVECPSSHLPHIPAQCHVPPTALLLTVPKPTRCRRSPRSLFAFAFLWVGSHCAPGSGWWHIWAFLSVSHCTLICYLLISVVLSGFGEPCQ